MRKIIARYDNLHNVWHYGYWISNTRFVIVYTVETLAA